MTGQIDHTETRDGITYTLSIEKDDQPVRGNVSAIGSGDEPQGRGPGLHTTPAGQPMGVVRRHRDREHRVGRDSLRK